MPRRRKSGKTSQAAAGSPPGRLRIVAGNWRSRVLEVADVEGLRPTAERVRETLFNWLAPRIEGARCLDLFAGTGALGFEALSRGAAHVTFVERSPAAVSALRSNAATLVANADIRNENAFDYLGRPAESPFNIVFLDPPFADERLADLCKLLTDGGFLARDARVYVEEDRGRDTAVPGEGWETLRQKTAGNVRYSLLRRADATK